MISFHENVQIGRQSAGPSCSGLALLGLIVALAASSTSVCQEPRFHVETGSARHSIRILLDHDVSIRGGTVVFRLDPSKFVIEAIELGADIPQGAQLFSNLFPLPESIGEDGRIYPVIDPILVVDEEGGEVPGGVVLGWMNSLDNDVLVEAGTRREICTLSFAPVGDAESEDCPAVNLEFLTDIRVGVDSQGPLQQSIITNAESVSALANTDSAILCVCEAPVVVSQELPTAYEGEEYALHLESSGGFLDPSWELVEPSALPAGLSLDPDGRIHGVPAPGSIGEYDFESRACDACPSGARCSDEKQLVLEVRALPRTNVVPGPQIEEPFLGDGRVLALSFAFSAAAGGDLALAAVELQNTEQGDASTLLDAVRLYADTNDNGQFDDGQDAQVGESGTFQAATQGASLTGLDEVIAAGSSRAFFLVVDIADSEDQSGAGAWIPSALDPWLGMDRWSGWLALALAVAALALICRSRFVAIRLSFATGVLCVVLCGVSSCNEGGGRRRGPGPAVQSNQIQVQIQSAQVTNLGANPVRNAATAGLPIAGPSFAAAP